MLIYLLGYLLTGLMVGIVIIDQNLTDLIKTSKETGVKLYWYIIVIELLHVLLWPVAVVGSIIDIRRHLNYKE